MARKNPVLVRLGKNLRNAREDRGWSQEELAFKAGVHRTYVGAVERGEYNVTILTLKKLTKTLGITLQESIRSIS